MVSILELMSVDVLLSCITSDAIISLTDHDDFTASEKLLALKACSAEAARS